MTKVKFFTAAWCSACKNVKPFVEQNAEVEFVDIDTAEGHEQASKLGIRGLPTLVKEDGSRITSGNLNDVKAFLGL